jgi:hypothetical protein
MFRRVRTGLGKRRAGEPAHALSETYVDRTAAARADGSTREVLVALARAPGTELVTASPRGALGRTTELVELGGRLRLHAYDVRRPFGRPPSGE